MPYACTEHRGHSRVSILCRGLLKHVGCGANAAFVSLPTRAARRPAFTGWLADFSVLAPGSKGLRWSDKVCAW